MPNTSSPIKRQKRQTRQAPQKRQNCHTPRGRQAPQTRQSVALEHQVLRSIKELTLPKPRRLLLAISGGVDSMVLATVLKKWQRGLKLELAVAHVHHGRGLTKAQTRYRNQTRQAVRKFAQAQGLRFVTNSKTPGAPLTSEEELRNFRERCLVSWCKRLRFDAVAFAHHQDDLLETRMIRLVRGSGLQGLQAMSSFKSGKLRPLLGISSSALRAYAADQKLQWCEDPSNQEVDALRNWMRKVWLPELEKKRPGALVTLARSLEHLANPAHLARSTVVNATSANATSDSAAAHPFHEVQLGPYVGLRRELFYLLSRLEQREILANYLRALGVKSYGQSHVNEILKRLNTKRAKIEFEMLGLIFKISPEFLWASRV